MEKTYTLLLLKAAFLLCYTLQAQKIPIILSNPAFQTALERNNQIIGTENVRFAADQTIRVAQQETYSSWGDNNQWKEETRITYTYNNRGLWETATVVSLPDNQNQAQYIYTYNSQGIATELILKSWEDNAWVNSLRMTFDVDGDLMNSFGLYRWENNSWLLNQGTRSTHTRSNGRVTETVTEYYSIIPPETQGWELNNRVTYEYTGSDNRPNSITTYSREGMQWIADEKETAITYVGSTSDRSSYFLEERDSSTNTWSKYKLEYQYSQDDANRTRTVIETTYRVDGTALIPSLRLTTTTLTSGETYISMQALNTLEETYDVQTGYWVRNSEKKATVTRDNNGDITQIVFQEYAPLSNAFVNTDRYVYSDFATITITSTADDALAQATEVYPNPVQNSLHVSLDASRVRNASLSIYNITGQKVYEQNNLKAVTTVDVSRLPAGIYMVRLFDERSATVTRRIVKQ